MQTGRTKHGFRVVSARGATGARESNLPATADGEMARLET